MTQEPDRGPVPRPTADEIDRVVAHALAVDPAVDAAVDRGSSSEGLSSLSQRLWQWFLDLLRSLDSLRFESPGLYWLVVSGLVAVLALLLAHIVWSLRTALGGGRGALEQSDDAALAARHARYVELLARARAAVATDPRQAVRLAVLALLARLDEQHVLRAANAWTLREILARLTGSQLDPTAVREFASRAERASYASTAPAPRDCEELLEHLELLVASIDRAAAARDHSPAEAVA